MNETVFVDTNVLVYARDTSEPKKQRQAIGWMDALWSARRGRTSIQVLSEFYATATMKLKPGLSPASAQADVRALLEWKPTVLAGPLLDEAFAVQGRWKLSWWDSLIVAAARTSGSRFLLSEDWTHGQRFGEVEVVSPFESSPSALGIR